MSFHGPFLVSLLRRAHAFLHIISLDSTFFCNYDYGLLHTLHYGRFKTEFFRGKKPREGEWSILK